MGLVCLWGAVGTTASCWFLVSWKDSPQHKRRWEKSEKPLDVQKALRKKFATQNGDSTKLDYEYCRCCHSKHFHTTTGVRLRSCILLGPGYLDGRVNALVGFKFVDIHPTKHVAATAGVSRGEDVLCPGFFSQNNFLVAKGFIGVWEKHCKRRFPFLQPHLLPEKLAYVKWQRDAASVRL